MTPSKYLFFRIVSHFGFSQKNVRLDQATIESRLLKEAEIFLGEAIWRKVEHIDELSMQYWNLRKLVKDHERVSKEIEQLQGEFNESHTQQTEGWQTASDTHLDLTDERKKALGELNQLRIERDRIVAQAGDIRRQHEGLKIKQEFLSKEGSNLAEIEKTASRLAELTNDFNTIKEDKENMEEKMAVANARIREIEGLVSERKQYGKTKATESSQSVAGANQQISFRRAQANTLNAQMPQLYMEIGRYVRCLAATTPECKKAGKDHRRLIDVMNALERSIQYNIKLAEHA
jgi:chromosome segregation ATPase